jgi:NADH-quinone oxidoreductase subunit N
MIAIVPSPDMFQRLSPPALAGAVVVALGFYTGALLVLSILLYGMALVYGVTGQTDFAGIRAGFDATNPLALVGLGLITIGFAFKVSSVPFHQWTPDVYEGAPTVVTAYMSVTVKTTAFLALMRFVVEAIGPAASTANLSGLFWGLAAITMIGGNVMAVIQDNVKRMLAYSSIAHAGYLLVGFATATPEAYAAVLFYLVVYVFMTLGAFSVMEGSMAVGSCVKCVEKTAMTTQKSTMSRPGTPSATAT